MASVRCLLNPYQLPPRQVLSMYLPTKKYSSMNMRKPRAKEGLKGNEEEREKQSWFAWRRAHAEWSPVDGQIFTALCFLAWCSCCTHAYKHTQEQASKQANWQAGRQAGGQKRRTWYASAVYLPMSSRATPKPLARLDDFVGIVAWLEGCGDRRGVDVTHRDVCVVLGAIAAVIL